MGSSNRLRRSRKTEGGACAQAHGLGCETALIASPAKPRAFAGLVFRTLFTQSALGLFWVGLAQAEIQLQGGAIAAPHDILWESDDVHDSLVVRLVVPEIARNGGSVDYDSAGPYMDRVCADIAVPTILNTESKIDRVLVVFMDQPVPRGQPMPEATQFINIYSLENGRCIWEDF